MAFRSIPGPGSGSGSSSSFQFFNSPFGDTTYTKVFVGGLAWETQSEMLRRHFQQFGDILEAVVISDKNTGRSKGYGFGAQGQQAPPTLEVCKNPEELMSDAPLITNQFLIATNKDMHILHMECLWSLYGAAIYSDIRCTRNSEHGRLPIWAVQQSAPSHRAWVYGSSGLCNAQSSHPPIQRVKCQWSNCTCNSGAISYRCGSIHSSTATVHCTC